MSKEEDLSNFDSAMKKRGYKVVNPSSGKPVKTIPQWLREIEKTYPFSEDNDDCDIWYKRWEMAKAIFDKMTPIHSIEDDG